jgi:hypothetical protein
VAAEVLEKKTRMAKKKKSAAAVFASVTKEMAQPRFAESARKEEVAHHHARAVATNLLKP